MITNMLWFCCTGGGGGVGLSQANKWSNKPKNKNRGKDYRLKYTQGGCCHKYFYCDRSFVATDTCLLWQNYVCHDRYLCLSWQAYFCCDNRRVLSWQTHVHCDKRHVLSWQTHVHHDKSKLVATKCLSRQKWYLWQIPPMIAEDCCSQQLPRGRKRFHSTTRFWWRFFKIETTDGLD